VNVFLVLAHLGRPR